MAILADAFIQEIESMTVLELINLVKDVEERFGVSSNMVTVATGGAAATATAIVEEQTEFSIELVEAGVNKLNVIKAVREIVSGLGLKEAKDMVDSAPKTIKEGLSKDEANKVKEKLEAAGAKVAIK